MLEHMLYIWAQPLAYPAKSVAGDVTLDLDSEELLLVRLDYTER